MTRDELADRYRGYIACLNRQDWENLHRFVADDVRYNGKRIGLEGYRAMLVEDFRAEFGNLRPMRHDWLTFAPFTKRWVSPKKTILSAPWPNGVIPKKGWSWI